MKKLILFLLYFYSLFFNRTALAQAEGLKPGFNNVPGVKYPQIDEQNSILFKIEALTAPKAQTDIHAHGTGGQNCHEIHDQAGGDVVTLRPIFGIAQNKHQPKNE